MTVKDFSLQFPHTTTDNEVLNGTANGLLVTFDRDINAATFTAADVLQMVGPQGAITGPFTITADPAGTPAALAKRVFLIGFPTQALNGTYTLSLAPTIRDTTTQEFGSGNEIDTNLNAGIDVLDGTNSTSTATTAKLYNTVSPLNIALPPGSTVTSTISISDAFQILQDAASGHHIQLEMDVNLTTSSDLQAKLVAPDGTTIQLFTNVGQGLQNPSPSGFQGTVFDDFATQQIQTGAPPFASLQSGDYKPQNPLSVLIGKSTLGNWQLVLTNTSTNDAGTLVHWALTFPHATPDTNLGEPVADQISTSFRIFNQDPANTSTTEQWTAVGPAPDNNGANSGPVNAIAVDPSDPSGNTVYVASATGGLWKTTDFLTTSPNGPTYVPLTNLGPTGSLNISSIAIFGKNNDPTQSVIYVMTGNPNAQTFAGDVTQPADQTAGIGLLESVDGGQTWRILDSSHNFYDSSNGGTTTPNQPNTDGNVLPEASPARDHFFVGLVGYQVVVDPTAQPNQFPVVYAAFSSGPNNPNGGLYRSWDGGEDWTLIQGDLTSTASPIKAGNATDVVLAAGSADTNGNLQILYAGFANDGVYSTFSATSATSLTQQASLYPPRTDGFAINAAAPLSTPNGAFGRIVLAVPDLTDNPLLNSFYQGWVYAATEGGPGSALYVSKDYGGDWTAIRLASLNGDTGTNNTITNLLTGHFDDHPEGLTFSLAVDPTNPEVVYLGGSNGQLLRIDTSNLADQYAMVAYNNVSALNAGTQFTTTGTVNLDSPGSPYGVLDVFANQPFPIELGPTGSSAYYNLYRDPQNPFVNPSTLQLRNIFDEFDNGKNDGIGFNNQGTGVLWGDVGNLKNSAGVTILSGTAEIGALVAIRDPLTGQARLLVGDENGVYTGGVLGVSAVQNNIGSDQEVIGSRNGNLQIAEMVDSAAQPSELAANLAGALFYGMSRGNNGFPASTSNILDTGNLNWNTQNANSAIGGEGEAVATDPTGSGQLYQFRWPFNINETPFTPTDFFLVTAAGARTTSRTAGLDPAGVNPPLGLDTAQWPPDGGSRFAVNPVNASGIIMSSHTGLIYRTTNTGVQWVDVAPSLTGSYANALAFGAPNPAVDPNVNDFFYAGTLNGHVFVTFHGGGANSSWVDLDNKDLDGSAIEQIQADPRQGSHDLYVTTQKGVYFMADSSAAGAKWVNITGNLFSLTRPLFNNPNDPYPTLTDLTSLVADWRFAIPSTVNPSGPKAPVLYVAGNGGVFRSEDQGKTWTVYPSVTADGAKQQGGLFPDLNVTSLSLVTGNINTSTGLPNTTTGFNMLVAGTYGQGDYAIRLDNAAVQQFAVVNFGGLQVTSIAPATSGSTLAGITATFNGPVDPQTVVPADITVYDPNGNPVAVATATDVTPTPPPGQPNQHNVYQFTFTKPQTAVGIYSVMISNATDVAGDKMAPYTGTLPFPYAVSEAVFNFPLSGPSGVNVGGIYGYRAGTGFQQLNTANATLLAINANGDIAAQFGSSGGVWRYTEATETWTELTPANAALLAIDGNGNVYADLRQAGAGLYELTSPTNNKQLTPVDPNSLAVDAAGDAWWGCLTTSACRNYSPGPPASPRSTRSRPRSSGWTRPATCSATSPDTAFFGWPRVPAPAAGSRTTQATPPCSTWTRPAMLPASSPAAASSGRRPGA